MAFIKLILPASQKKSTILMFILIHMFQFTWRLSDLCHTPCIPFRERRSKHHHHHHHYHAQTSPIIIIQLSAGCASSLFLLTPTQHHRSIPWRINHGTQVIPQEDRRPCQISHITCTYMNICVLVHLLDTIDVHHGCAHTAPALDLRLVRYILFKNVI